MPSKCTYVFNSFDATIDCTQRLITANLNHCVEVFFDIFQVPDYFVLYYHLYLYRDHLRIKQMFIFVNNFPYLW